MILFRTYSKLLLCEEDNTRYTEEVVIIQKAASASGEVRCWGIINIFSLVVLFLHVYTTDCILGKI